MASLCSLALSLAACTNSTPPATPPPANPDPAAAPTQDQDQLVMSGIKLYLYDAAATPGVERSPSFSVEADEFIQEAGKTWRFKGARAVVPPKVEGQETVMFDAGTGRLQEEESALLEDGVIATVGSMTIDMQTVHWLQAAADGAGMAYSDEAVSLVDPAMQLFAQQFRLYPAESRFTLMEVNGVVSFAPPQTEGAPAIPQEGNAAS